MRQGTTRRTLLALAAGASLTPLTRRAFASDAKTETHGLSIFGTLRYPANAPHFEYVNPDAPVGGIFSHVPGQRLNNQNFATFNSLNAFILRGDAAMQIETTFATLLHAAQDEPDSSYGLAARAIRHDAERRVFQFLLRPDLTFHDGSPLTADDVAWSIETLKRDGHPLVSAALRDVEAVTVDAPDALTVRFAATRTREAPQTVGGLPIFSRAWYQNRPFNQTTMEAPLGSGPYRVARFEQGRFIEYERVADWWGWRVPLMRGQYNFARFRVEYFRDRSVAFEAFKSGDFLFREEFTSRDWAQGYDFPAMRDARVVRRETRDETPSGAQGYFFNMRRPKFQDPRVREAIGLCFDYEWTNRNIFFGLYERNKSFFENSDMAARGMPSPAELALLEPFRGRIPDEVFQAATDPPVSDGTGSDRNNLRRASNLLREAGVTTQNGQARLRNGERLSVEFLDFEASFERITLPFIENLKRIGIDAGIRRVDPAQYQNRLKDFDFDVTSQRFGLGLTPGEGLRRMFSSTDADTQGSSNIAGIKNPAIDALIEVAIRAPNREELNTAISALDRVLRAMRPWVPHWYKGTHWLAYWDVFGSPPTKPRFARGVFETWWIDEAKARRIGKGL
jgi:microcin C transport system substrate-binding protein